jgi:putative PIN family toxin of toxin-antitoxin system
MRVVLDTNVLVSALLVEASLPAQVLTLWRAGRFTLLTSTQQLDELRQVTRYPKLRSRLTPALAGRLINELRQVAVLVQDLPLVDVSPDPYDNYLLAMASGGEAEYLVTGDKQDVLSLERYLGTRILSVRDFLTLIQALPMRP